MMPARSRRFAAITSTVPLALALVACAPSDNGKPAAAPAQALAPAPATNARAPSKPRRVPATLQRTPSAGENVPNAAPHADPFDEALQQSTLSAAGRSHVNTVYMRADRQSPRYLVLPVQTQGYGFAPAFRAIVGAQLDHELALRGVHASRQLDVASHYGPYMRRLGDDAIDQLAQTHPSSDLLAILVGHDGGDEGWLSIEVRPRAADSSPVRRVHRRFVLPADPSAAARAVAERLPGMLDELRPVAGGARLRGATASGCRGDVWQLREPARIAPLNERACHAFVVGSLLPPSSDEHPSFSSTATPVKLAWLAEAWVQSRSSGMHAIEAWSWRQLRLDAVTAPVPTGGGDDVVVAPIAALLSAEAAATDSNTIAEIAPPAGARGFARQMFIERTRFADPRRTIDRCLLDFLYPATTERTPCPSAGALVAPAERLISRAELDLYQSWRLASFEKELRRAALGDGDRKAWQRAADTLPEDVRRHPSIRRLDYLALSRRPIEQAKWFGGNRFESMRAEARDFVQTTAEMQRWDPQLDAYALSARPLDEQPNDDGLRAIAAAEQRLLDVLKADRFVMRPSMLQSEVR